MNKNLNDLYDQAARNAINKWDSTDKAIMAIGMVPLDRLQEATDEMIMDMANIAAQPGEKYHGMEAIELYSKLSKNKKFYNKIENEMSHAFYRVADMVV